MQQEFVDTRDFLSQTKFYEGYSRFKDEDTRYETWDEADQTMIEVLDGESLSSFVLRENLTDEQKKESELKLKQTEYTQPAMLAADLALYRLMKEHGLEPDMVAGHSLGEFSALVANGTLAFEDGLKLVYQRAMAMQEACEINPSTMAAILGLADEKVEEICAQITDEVVVPANYNCPGQLVISGSNKGILA